MTAVYEMSVRREHSVFTPTFHVTVATLDPIQVVEAFDVQPGQMTVAQAAEVAMERLRQQGYRLTDPVAECVSGYETYATAHLARDEQQAAAVELAAELVHESRMIARALPAIGSREGAGEVVRLVDELVASAQGLRARAYAVLHADEDVEAAAVLDHVMSELDGGGHDLDLEMRHHEAAVAAVHEEIEDRRGGGAR